MQTLQLSKKVAVKDDLSCTFYLLSADDTLVCMAKVWDEGNYEGYIDGSSLCWVETHPEHRRKGYRDHLLRAISAERKLYRTGMRSTLGRLASKNFMLPLMPGERDGKYDSFDEYSLVNWETGIPKYLFEV